MKSVTEFANFTLTQGLKAKTALTAEGKTPEEIQASLGTTFKYEGDKLKYFINALDVADKNQANLRRVVIMSLGEGETAPHKGVQVEELHYVPEFYVDPSKQAAAASFKGSGANKGKRGGGDSKKGSPWGLSPEEKAAKNGKAAAKAAPKPTT